METTTTTLCTQAVFSDDHRKRYLLTKTWEDDKPSLAILMLAPGGASGVALDTTTQLVLNNAVRLGYGRVSILNLFATLGDFGLKQAEEADEENLTFIREAAEQADAVVYAPGVGKGKNKAFLRRQEQVLHALRPFAGKLYCLTDEQGKARLQHPLSPAVRTWTLSPLEIKELLPAEVGKEAKPRRKGRKKKD